jgi:hypothetical protein
MRVAARVGVVVLLLLAAACGITPVPEPSSDPPASVSPPSESPAPAEVLDFEAQKLGGGVLRGSDYVGKDVAIWFWAPW